MEGFYGFKDGSGDWFFIVDTEKCNGCSRCVEKCPENVLLLCKDEFDPLVGETKVTVREEERKKIRYDCAPCKPGYGEMPPPCVSACEYGAISHTDAWKLIYGRN